MTSAARYDAARQPGRAAHSSRPGRESLRKRLGATAGRIYARDGHACVYCRRTEESSGAHLSLDHLTPRSVGGDDSPTNLVSACRRCNSTRKSMSLSRWAGYAEAALGLVFTPAQIRGQARRRLPELAR